MKIADIRLTGLAGVTVEGGWAAELAPDDNLHTIVEVLTDDGHVGIGSAMTSRSLVAGAVQLMRSLLIGERADEPARVSEKLRQHTFWQGRGGAVEHAISGIDIALWDLFGKIVNQPVARLLGGVYRDRVKPYGSLLFDEPEPLRAKLREAVGRGFRAIKLGWRPFGRRDSRFDELLIQTARETVGPDVELMVDAGGQRRLVAAWVQVGTPHRTDARGLRHRLVRGSVAAGRSGGFCGTASAQPRSDLRGRGSHPSTEFLAVPATARLRHRAAGHDQMRRTHRSLAHRLDGV